MMDDTDETILLLHIKKAIAPFDYDMLNLKNLTSLRHEVDERLDVLTTGSTRFCNICHTYHDEDEPCPSGAY